MSTPMSPSILLATALGLTLNTAFTTGSLALTNAALPAILLPANAPLMPPLHFVHKQRSEHFRHALPLLDQPSSTTPPSGADAGPTEVLAGDQVSSNSSPSSTSYIARQWFHVFAKGMHTYPPMAVGAALAYLYCTVMLPGAGFYRSLTATENSDPTGRLLLLKRTCYLLAFLLSAGVPPFTLTAMKPINSQLTDWVEGLCRREATEGSPSTMTTTVSKARENDSPNEKRKGEELIREWGRMNRRRSWLAVAAGVCATVALVLPV